MAIKAGMKVDPLRMVVVDLKDGQALCEFDIWDEEGKRTVKGRCWIPEEELATPEEIVKENIN